MSYREELLSEGWRTFQNELDAMERDNYDVSVYKTQIEVKVGKERGGNKQETMAEIRAIPNVTVVSTVPGSVRDDETHSYIVYSLAFVHQQNRFRTAKLHFAHIVREIKKLPSVLAVSIRGDMMKKKI